jgi:hypothetical protein
MCQEVKRHANAASHVAPNWIGLCVKWSVAPIAVSRINISIEAKLRLA